MLLGLPYVVVYARQDRSLNVLLLSRGVSGMRQLWDEWLSHFLSLLCLAAVVFAPVLVLSAVSDNAALLMLSLDEWLTYIAFFIPVLVMVSTFNLFIFEIGGNVVSSALLHFFSVLCMCYVSGCFYPVYTFPRAIQAVERLLPTGVARETLAIALSEGATYRSLIGVAVYAVLFFVGAWLVRMAKLRRREGGA
jgi:ABC-type multidrug transport system permease subunit